VLLSLLALTGSAAADWPQWRAQSRRQGHISKPGNWPSSYQKGPVPVFDGALRQPCRRSAPTSSRGNYDGEVLRCLDLGYRKENLHRRMLPFPPRSRTFLGPRSSPAVAEGTGVQLAPRARCTASTPPPASAGNQDDFKSWPRFFSASSPLIVDGLCIASSAGKTARIAMTSRRRGEIESPPELPTAYRSPL